MSSSADWKPPLKIEELFAQTSGNQFAAINAPTAGAREQKDLPTGNASIQLYSLATPNGAKAGIMLEELGIDYDAFVINIAKGEQFTSGFVGVNPNSKIPCMVDRDGPGGKEIKLFESGSIVLYLAEKYNRFIPTDPFLRVECFNWMFWQMGGQGPMTGNMGHFLVYAPADKGEARDYGVARYGMDVMRLCDVLERHLATGRTYLVGEEYSVADIMCFPWYNQLRTGYKHASGVAAADFLTIERYVHCNQWADRIAARPAVQRGLTVCHFSGVAKPWLATTEEGK